MTMFIHFFCLCPLIITIKLNFNISKVAYWLDHCAIGIFEDRVGMGFAMGGRVRILSFLVVLLISLTLILFSG